MQAHPLALAAALAATALVAATLSPSTQAADKQTAEKQAMELGNFSVSLTVKDIKASKAFYEKLGFVEVGGKLEQNWIVLQNGAARIGLFQGMFDKNILTFNPGWTKDKETLPDFLDVRDLQRILKSRGVALTTQADETTSGPAHFTVADPDGNMILFDQHVSRAKPR
jgi:catechol 2,3-dioxygenase-like lactoylglutathione lyase family enzyme